MAIISQSSLTSNKSSIVVNNEGLRRSSRQLLDRGFKDNFCVNNSHHADLSSSSSSSLTLSRSQPYFIRSERLKAKYIAKQKELMKKAANGAEQTIENSINQIDYSQQYSQANISPKLTCSSSSSFSSQSLLSFAPNSFAATKTTAKFLKSSGKRIKKLSLANQKAMKLLKKMNCERVISHWLSHKSLKFRLKLKNLSVLIDKDVEEVVLNNKRLLKCYLNKLKKTNPKQWKNLLFKHTEIISAAFI